MSDDSGYSGGGSYDAPNYSSTPPHGEHGGGTAPPPAQHDTAQHDTQHLITHERAAQEADRQYLETPGWAAPQRPLARGVSYGDPYPRSQQPVQQPAYAQFNTDRAMPQYIAPPLPDNPERNGLGLASIIVAVIGLVFALVPFTGFIALCCGLTAFALGLAGISRVRKHKATNKKTAIFGTILGLVAVIGGTAGIVMVFNAADQLSNDLDCISNAQTSAQMERC